MHSIAQINASIFEWSGERHALTFLAPIKPSYPGNVLSQPCPENRSLSFQDPSVKHHLPVVPKLGMTWTSCAHLLLLITCASAQSVDSTSSNRSVSLGSISRLLNTLLLWAFQMYHNIHTNWWSFIFGLTLQIRWSILAKREPIWKKFGFDGILDSAQTWRVGGHSKNTWFNDSSGSPHRAHQVSPCIPLALRFFVTAIQPDINCH